MKFELGRLVMTRGIAAKIDKNAQFSNDIRKALDKYINCNWGECCKEDSKMNNYAVKNESRILGTYDTCEGRIWIITERDRSATTILFPSEY